MNDDYDGELGRDLAPHLVEAARGIWALEFTCGNAIPPDVFMRVFHSGYLYAIGQQKWVEEKYGLKQTDNQPYMNISHSQPSDSSGKNAGRIDSTRQAEWYAQGGDTGELSKSSQEGERQEDVKHAGESPVIRRVRHNE